MTVPSATSTDFSTEAGERLTEQDYRIIDNVESSLRRGVQIRQWWDARRRTGGFAREFPLIRTFNKADLGYAFFDDAPVDGGIPVMGSVAEEFFDQPKTGAISTWQAELQEFVLRYFMRVSDFRDPDVVVDRNHPAPPRAPFTGISWCPQQQDSRGGFGYCQVYFKRRDTGQVGRFPPSERFAIVDVRELNEKYEWIVLKVKIFDFVITLNPPARIDPLSSDTPHIGVPLSEETFVVLSRDFTNNITRPDQEVAGRYGFGYALLNQSDNPGLLAYGPGHFGAGFQLFTFEAEKETGRTRSRRVFVVNRPERILNLPIDPLTLGCRIADVASRGLAAGAGALGHRLCQALPGAGLTFDPVLPSIRLLNALTGGVSSDQLCISTEQLEVIFLQQHFKQNYDLIVGALRTWREVPDWLDSAGIPVPVQTGRVT